MHTYKRSTTQSLGFGESVLEDLRGKREDSGRPLRHGDLIGSAGVGAAPSGLATMGKERTTGETVADSSATPRGTLRTVRRSLEGSVSGEARDANGWCGCSVHLGRVGPENPCVPQGILTGNPPIQTTLAQLLSLADSDPLSFSPASLFCKCGYPPAVPTECCVSAVMQAWSTLWSPPSGAGCAVGGCAGQAALQVADSAAGHTREPVHYDPAGQGTAKGSCV